MEDWMTVTQGASDNAVIQQVNGQAPQNLAGAYSLSDPANLPVVSLYDENTNEALVSLHRPDCQKGRWRCSLSIPCGKVIRVETGILLKAARFDGRFPGRGQVVRQVAAGEVYVVSGQSNAVGYARQSAEDPPDPRVRMRLPDGTWQTASHPVGYLSPPARGENTDPILPGHSPWLCFGRLQAERTGGPVGVVQTGKNGAAIREFRPGQPLHTLLFRILRETGAGHVVFYQGCTDVFHPDGYEEDLMRLLEALHAEVPDCVLVQISGTTNQNSPDRGWIRIREAQRSAAARLGIPLVPTWDCCSYSDDIHLSAQSNLRLAKRLTLPPPPLPLEAVGHAGFIELRFDRPVDPDRLLLPALKLEDGDQTFSPNAVSWDGDRALLYTTRPAQFVRPAFGRLISAPAPEYDQVLPYFHLAVQR